MGAKSTHTLPSDARVYSSSDWLTFGMTGTPNTREKLIALTIEEMVKVGPGEFNAATVCDRIDAKHALVNYYFGNKEMLIAEASATTYKKHILEIRDVINSTPRDPEKRLKVFLKKDLEWHRRMNDWAVVVSYPLVSRASRELIESNFGEELNDYFQYLVAMVSRMIRDIRSGTFTEIDFEPENLPMHELALHADIVLDAISLLYSSHGLNIWAAGAQIGSAKLDTKVISQKFAIDHHIRRMMELAKKR